MTYRRHGLLLLAFVAPLTVYACAEGDEGDGEPETYTGLDSGTKSDTSSTTTDSGTTTSDSGTSQPIDSGSTTKDSGVTQDAGSTTTCTGKNKCTTSRDIGAIDGDKGNDTLSAEGTTSEWLSFRATEALTGIFNPVGHKMKFNVTLTPPAGADFDLFVYMDPNDDVLECTSTVAQSANVGADSAGYAWGEGTTANASDDSRTVSVEVRYKSGTCAAGAKWKLTVEGNPP